MLVNVPYMEHMGNGMNCTSVKPSYRRETETTEATPHRVCLNGRIQSPMVMENYGAFRSKPVSGKKPRTAPSSNHNISINHINVGKRMP